jgi:hypothetical protein
MDEPGTPQPEKPRKIAWWRIGIGMLFILMVARSHFAPASKPLVASNPGEQLGMNAAPVTFFSLGLTYFSQVSTRLGLKTKNSSHT